MDARTEMLIGGYVEAATKRIVDDERNALTVLHPSGDVHAGERYVRALATHYRVGGRAVPIVAFTDGRENGFLHAPVGELTKEDIGLARLCVEKKLSNTWRFRLPMYKGFIIHTTEPHRIDDARALFELLGEHYEQDGAVRARFVNAPFDELYTYGPLEMTLETAHAQPLGSDTVTRIDDPVSYLRRTIIDETTAVERPTVAKRLDDDVLAAVLERISPAF